jgi:4-amino-4-deoxy-L-arabinose transferase-like glycosyltransferase
MTARLPSRVLAGLLLIVFLLVWFYLLGARTLVPTDEGRYAEMAREMLASGNWITPRLNGIKYFEKPPLQNWMNAATFALFGLGEWQARLWTGLNGLLGIVLVYITGRKLWNPTTGYMAAMVLASAIYWTALAHVNTLDMGLAGMMTLSLCSLLIAQRDEASRSERRNWMMACWAGMALAMMSKGLIGIVLPGAVLASYILLQRDWGIFKRLHLGLGLLLFFAIVTPWFVLVSRDNPEFLHFFFIHEHFQRFTSKVHNRAGPWYYFIPLLLVGILPWLGILFQALWRGFRTQATRFQPTRMLALWSVVIFVFFSVSGSKLPSYILPIFPALALLLARYLLDVGDKAVKISAALVALICAVGLFFVPRVGQMGNGYEAPLYQAHMPWVAAAVGLALAGSVAAWLMARRSHGHAALMLGASTFLAGQLAMLGHEPLGRYAAGVAHIPAIEAELKQPGTPLYSVGRYEQALPFYLRHTLILVEHADEMGFGLQQEPDLWIPKREEFVRRWQAANAAGQPQVAILSTPVYQALSQSGLAMRVIGQDPKRVIVAGTAKPAEKPAGKQP